MSDKDCLRAACLSCEDEVHKLGSVSHYSNSPSQFWAGTRWPPSFRPVKWLRNVNHHLVFNPDVESMAVKCDLFSFQEEITVGDLNMHLCFNSAVFVFQECKKESYLCCLVLLWDYRITPLFILLIYFGLFKDISLHACVNLRLCLPIKEPNSEIVWLFFI